MTLYLGLVRHQCRVVAVVGFAGWAIALFFALAAQLTSGVPVGTAIAPEALLAVGTVLLPEVLQVVIPLSLVHGLLSLEEGGELRAAWASGARPAIVVAAVLTPLVPLVAVMKPLVDEGRPAALAYVRFRAVDDPETLLAQLGSQGVGVVRDGSRVRALLPVGRDALAVTAAGVTPHREGLRLGDGSVVWIGASSRVDAGFAALDLTMPTVRPGLDGFSEHELSTRFLQLESMRWRRSRLDWGGRQSGEMIALALARRRWVLPGVLIGIGIALGLLLLRRPFRAAFAHGLCSPIAVAVSLFLPRWVA